MVQHVVDMLLALVELLEAEAGRLNVNVRGLLAQAGVVVIAAFAAGGLLVLGSLSLVWAGYAALRPAFGEALAALIVGLVIWILVGGATWLGYRRMKQRRPA